MQRTILHVTGFLAVWPEAGVPHAARAGLSSAGSLCPPPPQPRELGLTDDVVYLCFPKGSLGALSGMPQVLV